MAALAGRLALRGARYAFGGARYLARPRGQVRSVSTGRFVTGKNYYKPLYDGVAAATGVGSAIAVSKALFRKRKRTGGKTPVGPSPQPQPRPSFMPFGYRGRRSRRRWSSRKRPRYSRRGSVRRQNKPELKRILVTPNHSITPQLTNVPGVTASCICLGADPKPTAWASNASVQYFPSATFVDGISCPTGLNNSQRVGTKAYFLHTSLKLTIQMVQTTAREMPYPTQFRMIVCKVRRDNSAQPRDVNVQVCDPWDDMFLRTSGLSTFGPGSPASEFWPTSVVNTGPDENYMTPELFMRALTNKAKLKIFRDFKFNMSPPIVEMANVDGSSVYPNMNVKPPVRNLYLRLRHRKRFMYENQVSLVEPKNYDWRYMVFLFAAQPQATDADLSSPPRNYTVSASGLTLFKDP